MLPRALVIAIVCLVAGLWATNVVVGMFDPARAVEGLNTLFGAIVGGALAADRPAVRSLARRIGQGLTRTLPPDERGEEVPR